MWLIKSYSYPLVRLKSKNGKVGVWTIQIKHIAYVGDVEVRYRSSVINVDCLCLKWRLLAGVIAESSQSWLEVPPLADSDHVSIVIG